MTGEVIGTCLFIPGVQGTVPGAPSIAPGTNTVKVLLKVLIRLRKARLKVLLKVLVRSL